MGGNKGGREASEVDPESHRVMEGEGGLKAIGVAENPGGGAPRSRWVVESPQGAETPGVAEGPRGDETPGSPTASQDQWGEDRRGWGIGDKNTLTARETRRQGAGGSDGLPKGELQTAEPTVTMETTEEDGGKGPRPAQSDGANSPRSEHGALARRKYDRPALEATEGGQATVGAAGG